MASSELPQQRTDFTMSAGHAYTWGTLLYILIWLVLVAPHVLLSGKELFETGVAAFEYNGWILLGLFVASVVIHELLHGVGFHYFGGVPWSEVRYGFNWRYLVPYASTTRPMTAKGYRWAALLPLIVTGLVPAAVGTALGDSRLVSFAAFMAGAAAGDVLVVWAIREIPPTALVRDSSSRVGCEVVGPDFA
ncbi:MAG TPA: DUF3267 domain-containing protein [Longimicrobiales bacterium]|nr:DUF3267 domain-containing protein [Longimicrobiales bacterium]